MYLGVVGTQHENPLEMLNLAIRFSVNGLIKKYFDLIKDNLSEASVLAVFELSMKGGHSGLAARSLSFICR
jgi:hypothetical protein